MISEKEIQLINKLINVNASKGDLALLKDIYKRETNKTFNGCFCSASQRKLFKKIFYEWFNNEYPQNPEA